MDSTSHGVPPPAPSSLQAAAPSGGPAAVVDLLWLLAVWAAVFLTHLGTGELRLEEPHRVEPALAMVESGRWAVPLVGGEPYYRKPPLFNWLIAASFQLTGSRTELTARLPSALMMLALAWTVYLTGRGWMGRSGAFGAGLIALSASAMVDKGRLAELDATYTALTGMACAVWLEGWARRCLSAGHWAVVGALLGLGLLTKGPPHLAFFLALAWLCLGPAEAGREALRGRFWLGVACAALPLALWLWVARHSLQEAPSVWLEQMTGRFASGYSLRTLWRSLRTCLSSLLNFMPWLPLAAALAQRASWESVPEVQRRFLKVAGWLALVTVVLLPAVPGYRARYSMPVYAPLFLALALAGELLHPGTAAWKLWRGAALAAAWAAAAAGLAGPVLGAGSAVWLGPLGSAVAVGALIWWRGGRSEENHEKRRRHGKSRRLSRPIWNGFRVVWGGQGWLFGGNGQPGLWHLSASVAVALALAVLPVLAPQLARRERERPAAARVAAFLAPGERLYALRPGHVPFLFYLQGRFQVVLRPEELPAGELVLLTTPSQAETLGRSSRQTLQVLAELDGAEQPLQLLKLGPAPRP